MIQHRLPMDAGEIARIVAILRGESWVQQIRNPGTKPDEVGVDCVDGKSWRIARPIHVVRLKYRYRQ